MVKCKNKFDPHYMYFINFMLLADKHVGNSNALSPLPYLKGEKNRPRTQTQTQTQLLQKKIGTVIQT